MANDKLRRKLSKLVRELANRGLTLEQARGEFEKQFIVASLKNQDGNLGRAAKAIGVHRNTLRNKVTTLGIDLDELRADLKKGTR